jgi:hypothetical protein
VHVTLLRRRHFILAPSVLATTQDKSPFETNPLTLGFIATSVPDCRVNDKTPQDGHVAVGHVAVGHIADT